MTDITQELSEQDIEQTLKGIEIPSPPQIIIKLQAQMELPDVEIETIVQIISKDAGISGKVIKLINSPFFSIRSHVISISHAINLLGIQNTINIVNSIAIRQTCSGKQLINMASFWDNSADVAMVSTYISRCIGIAVPDEAYTLGLFHNVGIALLVEKFPEYLGLLKQAYSEQSSCITDIESDKINCNHAVVGYYVARAWKLPLHICEAIVDHHAAMAIFSDEQPCKYEIKNLLAILKLAETISKTYTTFGNESTDYEFERIKEGLFFYLGISECDFEKLKAEVIYKVLIH